MLAFAQANRGERIALDYDTGGVNLTAYAVLDDQEHLMLTLINKDQNADADVTIAAGSAFQKATALRLKGLALDSADDVTLGGSEVAADGRWQADGVETLHAVRRRLLNPRACCQRRHREVERLTYGANCTGAK